MELGQGVGAAVVTGGGGGSEWLLRKVASVSLEANWTILGDHMGRPSTD